MTKKDYELLTYWAGKNFIAFPYIKDLARMLGNQNTRFDGSKFLDTIQQQRNAEAERTGR